MSGERFFRSNNNLRTCHVKEEYYYKKAKNPKNLLELLSKVVETDIAIGGGLYFPTFVGQDLISLDNNYTK